MTKRQDKIQNDLPNRGLIVPHRIDQMKILQVSMGLSNERVQVLEQICKIRGEFLREYVEKALCDKMEADLETPDDLGLDYCKHLKKILSSELE
jgi:uncharacterized protein (DUF302 family)